MFGEQLRRFSCNRKRKRSRVSLNRFGIISAITSHLPGVGPRPELHRTVLGVEGEVADLNVAGAFVDSGWHPGHRAIAEDYGVGLQ